MGCCIPKGCQEACDPCCRRIGCSCRDRDGELMADIETNRSCTDLPCIVAFGAFLVFLVSFIWGPAFAEGDPDRFVHAYFFAET